MTTPSSSPVPPAVPRATSAIYLLSGLCAALGKPPRAVAPQVQGTWQEAVEAARRALTETVRADTSTPDHAPVNDTWPSTATLAGREFDQVRPSAPQDFQVTYHADDGGSGRSSFWTISVTQAQLPSPLPHVHVATLTDRQRVTDTEDSTWVAAVSTDPADLALNVQVAAEQLIRIHAETALLHEDVQAWLELYPQSPLAGSAFYDQLDLFDVTGLHWSTYNGLRVN